MLQSLAGPSLIGVTIIKALWIVRPTEHKLSCQNLPLPKSAATLQGQSRVLRVRGTSRFANMNFASKIALRAQLASLFTCGMDCSGGGRTDCEHRRRHDRGPAGSVGRTRRGTVLSQQGPGLRTLDRQHAENVGPPRRRRLASASSSKIVPIRALARMRRTAWQTGRTRF